MDDKNHQNDIPYLELQKAWQRYMSNHYSEADVYLILSSFKDDAGVKAFYAVSDAAWQEAMATELPESEAEHVAYRQEAARMLNAQRPAPPQPARGRQLFMRQFAYWKVAAAVLLVGMAGFALLRTIDRHTAEQQSVQQVQYVDVVVPKGETQVVTLPDGSKVTLNAGSSLRYPETFAADGREVSLTGEAFFEVAHRDGQPFSIQAGATHVKVLGTTFDVNAYDEDRQATVAVVTGKVEVKANGKKAVLIKNQQFLFNKTSGKVEVTNVDATTSCAWLKGNLYFNSTPLREAVNMINRRYPNIHVELAEGEYSNLISGRHDGKKPGVVIASIINSTGLKYKRINNRIILYKSKK